MKTRFSTAVAAAVFVSAFAFAAPSFAQDKMGGDKMAPAKMDKMGKMDKMSGGKMQSDKMAKKPVYVSKESKMGFTPMQAKSMKMMDTKGHKLVKMNSLPAGFKMAPAKMDKMDGGKMGGGKMDGGKMDGGKMDGGKMEDKKPGGKM